MENVRRETVTEREAATMLSVAIQTLRNWRYLRRGPAYCKIGGRAVRYRLCDLRDFIDNSRIDPAGSPN